MNKNEFEKIAKYEVTDKEFDEFINQHYLNSDTLTKPDWYKEFVRDGGKDRLFSHRLAVVKQYENMVRLCEFQTKKIADLENLIVHSQRHLNEAASENQAAYDLLATAISNCDNIRDFVRGFEIEKITY
jgi:formylglycine-generating enzyme required for sulfatase activity